MQQNESKFFNETKSLLGIMKVVIPAQLIVNSMFRALLCSSHLFFPAFALYKHSFANNSDLFAFRMRFFSSLIFRSFVVCVFSIAFLHVRLLI